MWCFTTETMDLYLCRADGTCHLETHHQSMDIYGIWLTTIIWMGVFKKWWCNTNQNGDIIDISWYIINILWHFMGDIKQDITNPLSMWFQKRAIPQYMAIICMYRWSFHEKKRNVIWVSPKKGYTVYPNIWQFLCGENSCCCRRTYVCNDCLVTIG